MSDSSPEWLSLHVHERACVLRDMKEVGSPIARVWFTAHPLGGTAVHIEHEDGCAQSVRLPDRKMPDPAAVSLGRKGGSKNTQAQNDARAENGKKGGRPRKEKK